MVNGITVLVKEEMTKQTIKAIWNNIAITIDYVPNYSNSVKELTGETRRKSIPLVVQSLMF